MRDTPLYHGHSTSLLQLVQDCNFPSWLLPALNGRILVFAHEQVLVFLVLRN